MCVNDAKTLIYWDRNLCRLNSCDWQHTHTHTLLLVLVYYCSYNDTASSTHTHTCALKGKYLH